MNKLPGVVFATFASSVQEKHQRIFGFVVGTVAFRQHDSVGQFIAIAAFERLGLVKVFGRKAVCGQQLQDCQPEELKVFHEYFTVNMTLSVFPGNCNSLFSEQAGIKNRIGGFVANIAYGR